jgi:hypothetical protein
MLKNLFSLPLADARGSVTASESAPAFRTATVKEWQEALFQHHVKALLMQ